MPSNFNKSLDTMSAPDNSATGYVNTSSVLAQVLPGIVQGAQTLVDTVATNKFQNAVLNTQGTDTRDFKQEIADARDAVFSEAAQKDKQVAAEYQAKYDLLIRAERQGGISGTNAGLRQEALLKQYINRFPHLESQFRSTFSSTRAVNEASKLGAVEDPIDKGRQEAQQAAAKLNMPLAEYLAKEQEKYNQGIASIRAKNGDNVFGNVRGIVLNKAKTAFDRIIDNLTSELEAVVSQGGTVDGAEMEARFGILAQQMYFEDVENPIATIMQNAENKDVALSTDQYAYLDRLYKQSLEPALAFIKTQDSLERLKKSNAHRTELRSRMFMDVDDEMEKEVPLYTYFSERNPEFATQAYAELHNNMKHVSEGRINFVENQIKNAQAEGNTMEMIQHKLSLAAIRMLTPAQINSVNKDILEGRLDELPTYGNPEADALADQQTLYAANGSMTQEDQAKVTAAAMKKNLTLEGRIGIHWVVNPEFNKQLKNPAARKEIDQAVNSTSTAAISEVPQKDAGSIRFNADKATDPNSYKQGPFTSPVPRAKSTDGRILGGDALYLNLDTLNTSYWIKRTMYGKPTADVWAKEVMAEFEHIAEPPTPKQGVK